MDVLTTLITYTIVEMLTYLNYESRLDAIK